MNTHEKFMLHLPHPMTPIFTLTFSYSELIKIGTGFGSMSLCLISSGLMCDSFNMWLSGHLFSFWDLHMSIRKSLVLKAIAWAEGNWMARTHQNLKVGHSLIYLINQHIHIKCPFCANCCYRQTLKGKSLGKRILCMEDESSVRNCYCHGLSTYSVIYLDPRLLI